MAGVLDKLPIIQRFLDSLTWKNLAQLSVFLFVVFFAYAVYENRQSIYNFVNQEKLEKTTTIVRLSPTSEKEIRTVVDKSEIIIAMQVTVVDFQRNSRTPIFTYSDNLELLSLYARYVDTNIDPSIPLFNNDQVNNKRTVDLINGEFVCSSYEETIGSKYLSDAGKFIISTCATGIPPFYGRFTGIITIYLNKVPTSEEHDQIRALSKKFSATIYDRDM